MHTNAKKAQNALNPFVNQATPIINAKNNKTIDNNLETMNLIKLILFLVNLYI